MKELLVKKICIENVEVSDLPILLDKEKVAFHSINEINWEAFPYHPSVIFRIAHTENALLLNYRVTEKSVRARYRKDNEAVWTDACVEFFVIPGENNVYYNIECNCIGTILLGSGVTRNERERAPQNILSRIKRWSSLGRESFEECIAECSWEVALIIPYSVFYRDNVFSLDGRTLRANFYKCGDELHEPHFLSWNAISSPKPNFHLPDFFGRLYFE